MTCCHFHKNLKNSQLTRITTMLQCLNHLWEMVWTTVSWNLSYKWEEVMHFICIVWVNCSLLGLTPSSQLICIVLITLIYFWTLLFQREGLVVLPTRPGSQSLFQRMLNLKFIFKKQIVLICMFPAESPSRS